MTGPVYPDWDAVYRDNVTWVYRLMFGKVGNPPDAEDLTAEVFMTALPPLRVSATMPEVRKYLRMTARTVLASYWGNRMGRELTLIEDDLPEPDEPEAVAGDAPAKVRRLLERLPDNYRSILELRFLQAFSVREAAAQMGVSVANAKVFSTAHCEWPRRRLGRRRRERADGAPLRRGPAARAGHGARTPR